MRWILFFLMVVFCPVWGFSLTVKKDVVAVVMDESALIPYEKLLGNDLGTGLRVTDFRGLDADKGVLIRHEDYAEFQRTSNFLGHTSFEYEVTDSSGEIAWGSVFFCQGKAKLMRGSGGDADNRIDLFIVGDGFTKSDLGSWIWTNTPTYRSRVNAALFALFGNKPGGTKDPYWDSDLNVPSMRYKNWFNVYRIEVVSNESGVSVEGENKEVADWLDTPFRAYKDHYVGSDGITYNGRLLTFDDMDRAREVARQLVQVAGYDIGDGFEWGIAAGNNGTRNNSGGRDQVLTWSVHDSSSEEIMIHEAGHAWHQLGEEYHEYKAGENIDIPLINEPRAINSSIDPTGTLKWGHWLGYDNPYDQMSAVGAVKEVRMWIPTDNSVMRDANTQKDGFSAPSREKMILDYHRLVNVFDDVLASDEVLYNPETLWVDVVDPEVIKVDWFVDGSLIEKKGQEIMQLSSLGLKAGVYRITARIYDEAMDHAFLSTNSTDSEVGFDPLDLVRRDLDQLEERVDWDVVVTGSGPAKLVVLEDSILAGEPFDIWVVDGARSGEEEVAILVDQSTHDVENEIKLVEVYPGVFTGTLNTGIGAGLSGNGVLELEDSLTQTLRARYTDASGKRRKDFIEALQFEVPTDMVRYVAFDQGGLTNMVEGVSGEVLVPFGSVELTEGPDGGGAVHVGSWGITLDEGWGQYLHRNSTFSVWFNTTESGHSDSVNKSPQILGLASPGVHWGWIDGEGRVGALRDGEGGAKSLTAVNEGFWHHLTITRNMISGLVSVYVDGKFQSSVFDSVMTYGGEFKYLGAMNYYNSPSSGFDGKLDDVRLFDRILSDEEIAGLARASMPLVPVAVDDTFSLGSQSVGLVNVLRNDISLEGHDGLRVVGVTQGSKGSVEILPDYSLRYTAGSGFDGSDEFKYTVEGNSGIHIATATVTVSINGNSRPVARDDYMVTGTGQAIRLDLSSNDVDSEGQPLLVRWVSKAENGEVVQNSAGDYIYTPNENFHGVEALTYTAGDHSNGVAEAVVYVTVLNSGSAINHESLTAFWRLDGDLRDTAPYGEMNDDGISNAPITFVEDTDRGTVLELSGSEAGVRIPSRSDDLCKSDDGHSVSLWFRADDVQLRRIIFEHGFEKSTSSIGVNMYIDAGQLYMGSWMDEDWKEHMQIPIHTNRWYHAAWQFDAENEKFVGFLDGQLIRTIDLPAQYPRSSRGGGMGSLYNDTWLNDEKVEAIDGYGFDGRISNVRFFSRVISAEDVQALSSEHLMEGHVATPADKDADGLQDAWEIKHFNGDVSPDENGDGDRFTNFEEYIVGSDPTRSESGFEIAAKSKADASGYIVSWASVSNRTYSVYWTDALDHDFQLLEDGIEYPQTEYTDTVHQVDAMFYKLDVQLNN